MRGLNHVKCRKILVIYFLAFVSLAVLLRQLRSYDVVEDDDDLSSPPRLNTSVVGKKTNSTKKATSRAWIPFGGTSAGPSGACCVYQGNCLASCSCYENSSEAIECVAKGWLVSDRYDLQCPNDCSGHGVCIEGVCHCEGANDHLDLSKDRVRYFGLDCSLKTAPGQLLPSYMIVGTQKGGTTALSVLLQSHPQIMNTTKKELHFYNDPTNRRRGIHWYLSQMQEHNETELKIQKRLVSMGKKVITGEATPITMLLCDGARLLYSLFPHIKIIIALREPVSRIYSSAAMNEVNMNRTGTDYTDALRSALSILEQSRDRCVHNKHVNWASPCCEPLDNKTAEAIRARIVSRGLYSTQIQQFLKFFPREQIMILNHADIRRDVKEVGHRVEKFLGIDYDDYVSVSFPPFSFPSDSVTIQDSMVAKLKRFYAPFNQQLFEMLGEDWGWSS